MLKNILNLEGVQELEKTKQTQVKGGCVDCHEGQPCFRIFINGRWVCA